MRILAIDDCGKSRSLIAAALGAEVHEVRLAGSGREGLAELQRGAVDVLITEVLMPIMDGLEVIKAARRSHPDLWIIAISGGGKYLSANVALTFARALGADRILYKPFVEAELKTAIEPAEGVNTTRLALCRHCLDEKLEDLGQQQALRVREGQDCVR